MHTRGGLCAIERVWLLVCTPVWKQRTKVRAMFLIRLTFWIALVILLLPADEHQQARLYASAAAAVERTTSFCDRNAHTCAWGAQLWAAFLKKAEFGLRMAFDLASSQARGNGEASPAREGPRRPSSAVEMRGTLTPNDLAPAWRGGAAGTRS
jgi:hypothetical protein